MQQSAVADHRHPPPPDFFIQYFPQGLKVLLVGSDNVAQDYIQTQLQHPYYQITKCSTAASALDLLLGHEHNSFDLVLSDVVLRDMDGFQFIRQQHSNTNIPHVVICGGERSSEIVTAYRFGACYVLLKPVSECELRYLWQHVCRRREQHEAESDFFNNNNSDVDDARQHHQNQDQGSSSKDKSPKVEDDSHFVNHVGEPSLKKRRIVWSRNLHELFVNAVNELGGEESMHLLPYSPFLHSFTDFCAHISRYCFILS